MRLFVLSVCLTVGATAPSLGQSAPRVTLTFVPRSDTLAVSARQYDSLWRAEGHRIVPAMERISGLRFITPEYADTAITVNVVEMPSNSGYRDRPMRMRASYPLDTKKATLVHELGHRLQSHLFRREEEEHGPLFLWVYDVWVELWGKEFADEQVVVEKRRDGPYPKAWDDALALTAAERAERWRAIVDERTPARR